MSYIIELILSVWKSMILSLSLLKFGHLGANLKILKNGS